MEETVRTTKKKSRISIGKIFLVFIILALIAGVSALGYLYYQTRQELKFLSSPEGQQQLVQQESSELIFKVSKHVDLPDEEPVIATISDSESLKSQSAFYKNAQNGDKLLVFQEAKQAFIYSSTRDRLVNVGPILVDGSPVEGNTAEAIETFEELTPTIELESSPTPSSQLIEEQVEPIDESIE
jgi:hypothetical protein